MRVRSWVPLLLATTCGGQIEATPPPPPADAGDPGDGPKDAPNDAGAEAGLPPPADASDCDVSDYGHAWLAFDSDRDGTRGIYLVRADGTGLVRFTTSAYVEKEPAFSPDGTRLAYTTDASGQLQIHVLDLATLVSTQLTHRPYGAAQPAWSRDGSLVAFVGLAPGYDGGSEQGTTGVTDVFVIHADGTGETDVVGPDSIEHAAPQSPTFGADPGVVVYTGYERIEAITLDGGAIRDIAGMPTTGTETPTVSPDGSQLAYAVWFKGEGIHVMDFDGSCTVPYPTGCSTMIAGPGGQYASYRRPSWSGDGLIAFETISAFNEPADLAIVAACGGAVVAVTSGPADDRNPTWAPTGFNP